MCTHAPNNYDCFMCGAVAMHGPYMFKNYTSKIHLCDLCNEKHSDRIVGDYNEAKIDQAIELILNHQFGNAPLDRDALEDDDLIDAINHLETVKGDITA